MKLTTLFLFAKKELEEVQYSALLSLVNLSLESSEGSQTVAMFVKNCLDW